MAAESSSSDPIVLVVVPAGTRRPELLCSALSEHHPTWEQRLIWAGDPLLPSALPEGLQWWRPREASVDELALVRAEPTAVPWLVALTAMRALRHTGSPVIVLLAGAVAIAGDVSSLVPDDDGAVLLVPRTRAPLTVDGSDPDLRELGSAGLFSTSVAGFGPNSDPAAEWMIDRILDPDPIEIGRVFELASHWFPSATCRDPRIGASPWAWDQDRPSLIDAPDYDDAQPWVLDPTAELAGRISLNVGRRRAVIEQVGGQLAGRSIPLSLPGAIAIDYLIRGIVRRQPEPVPAPWTHAAAFRGWIRDRYWLEVHSDRPDIERQFPYPAGRDAEAFGQWARHSVARDGSPLMMPLPSATSSFRRVSMRNDGVDIVGYLHHQSGVAEVGRQMVRILRAANLPSTALAYQRCPNPRLSDPPATHDAARFASTLGFVNGDQFVHLRGDHAELFVPGVRRIGYWFWELSTLRGGPPVDADGVDEIWTATSFTAEAFRESVDVPVRVVPLPIAEPRPSDRGRAEFAPTAQADDRFVFGVVLDYLSVTARKNPIGAIRSFKMAFAPGEGPLLVVKTLNARARWSQHERVLHEIADRPDIQVWDHHLTSPDHHAFIASLDCLVSLHRSEGLGLHLGQAMWLGVPVIATRYSGNLDFMDDDNSMLIDATIVPVTNGEGAYPDTAVWAEPDLADAAEAMRTLYTDAARRRSLSAAGRVRMQDQSTERETALMVADLLGLDTDGELGRGRGGE